MHLRSKPCNINGYLVHTWEGFHKLRSNVNVLNCTHMHTYIHSPKHTQSQMEQINFHSFCSKQNSTYEEKHFITGFFLSFNKKWKKKILQHLNGRIFCCSLLLVNRDALSLAVVTFFSILFFLCDILYKKCAVIVR